jgi:hypothetical protein
MSDNGNPTTKDNQLPAQAGAMLQILISWDQVGGQFNVNGFLGNKVIVLGMLEMAKDTFLKMCEQNEKSGGIVLAIPNPNLRM